MCTAVANLLFLTRRLLANRVHGSGARRGAARLFCTAMRTVPSKDAPEMDMGVYSGRNENAQPM